MSRRKRPATVGWREWVDLPELGIHGIKAKVDTGARSSALHAVRVRRFERDGQQMVSFSVHPDQRSTRREVRAEAEVVDERVVRASSGHETLRPVIRTRAVVAGRRVTLELTLASRDQMGFRMLLGRQALRRRFLVDPGRSFLGGKREEGQPLPDPGGNPS